MHTKTAKILFISLGGLLLILIFYFIFSKNGNQLTIKTPAGKVSIINPATLPNKKPLSMNGVNFKENTNYSIDYYPQDQGFIIAILNTDIQLARDMAEKDFLTTLNISQTDACKLKVSLAVPFDVNENASGINYRLSFCPNGKTFPK